MNRNITKLSKILLSSICLIGLSSILMSCNRIASLIDTITDASTDQVEFVDNGKVEEEAAVVEQGQQLVKLHATVQYANEVPHRSAQAGNNYYASNTVDGNPATCWCSTEYQHMNEDHFLGDGPTLTFNVRCSKLDHVVIYNGYCKNSSSYRNNSRYSSIIIYNATSSNWDGSEPIEKLVDTNLNDTFGAQTFNIPATLKTNNNITEIGIFLGDWYYGSKWPDDICLSEIEFWGYE